MLSFLKIYAFECISIQMNDCYVVGLSSFFGLYTLMQCLPCTDVMLGAKVPCTLVDLAV